MVLSRLSTAKKISHKWFGKCILSGNCSAAPHLLRRCAAVIGLLMCDSTLRRPLCRALLPTIDTRICGSSEAALLSSYIPWLLFNFGIKLSSYPYPLIIQQGNICFAAAVQR